jgi:poly(3-hydroxybutyrate) depolymerase
MKDSSPIPVILAAASGLLLLLAPSLSAEVKVERDVRYGPHPRNVMDVYWKTEYKNAPIVFTIHGGGFKNGSKAYCNKDMQDLYMSKGCIVVSPNYRLMKQGSSVTPNDCVLDVAMAVAHIQANAGKFGGDPEKIISTGASAGGHISAQIAYRKKWDWPTGAKHKPEKLNVVGWFGNSPGLPPALIKQVGPGDPPGFVMYGGREHPKTPASQGHQIQAALKEHKVWSKMVYIAHMGHVPAKRVLFSPRTRDKETHLAFSQFLDMVCHAKGKPEGGDVIKVKRK